MHMEISTIKYANRVEIFKHLAVDELDGTVNLKILNSIACDNYHAFLEFCDQVYQDKDRIKEISCTVRGRRCRFNADYIDS